MIRKDVFRFVKPRVLIMPKIFRGRGPRKGVPSEAGRYYWSEWDSVVTVSKRGNFCYVTPPARTAVEIKITYNIAGHFSPILTEL